MYRVERIATFSDLVVYKRLWKEMGMRAKYFVCRESDGRILEEFKRKSSAIKWARENS